MPDVASVDGLMVGCSIAYEKQLFQTLFDLVASSSNVVMAIRERSMKGGDPQGCVIALSDEISPEAEAQFGDDLPVAWGLMPGAMSGTVDIVAAAVIERRSVEPVVVPVRGRPV